MSCPNCESTQTDVNELDGSICCLQCGTVIEDALLRETFEESANYVPATSRQKAGNHSRLLSTFSKAAVFFGLPEDLVETGKELCREFISKSTTTFLNEVAVYVAFIVSREWKPEWNLMDFVEAFPIPLYLPQVYRTRNVLKGSTHAHWRTPQEELNYFIVRIYPLVVKQVYRDHSRPKSLSLSELKSKTRALLDLGSAYCLNTAKKARPLMVVTALIAGLSIRVTNPANYPKRSKMISARRRFCFSEFTSVCFSSKVSLSTRYDEYLDLLFACASCIPWIKKVEKSYVHYYLDDILSSFGTKTPVLVLPLDRFAIRSYQRNQQMRKSIETSTEEAKQCLREQTEPNDKSSIVYAIYSLLQFGFQEHQIVGFNEAYIRNMAHSLLLRNLTSGSDVQLDLDREEVDEKDMDDKEIETYLK
ncbi:hypothetical protein EDC96DRAFT_548634 [Choanephora cucurbitarum]|nr:hypothetical protein EDC96DRAFT_548634 [Choanephora cucurbitarum]